MTKRYTPHRQGLRNSNDAGLLVAFCSLGAMTAVDPAVLSSPRNWLIYASGCLLAGLLAYATPARRVPVIPLWRTVFMVFIAILAAAALRVGRWSQALAIALPAVGAAAGHQLLVARGGAVQVPTSLRIRARETERQEAERPRRLSRALFRPKVGKGGLLGSLGGWALRGTLAGLALALAVSLITGEHNPALLRAWYFQLYEGLCISTFGFTLAFTHRVGKSKSELSDVLEFVGGLVFALGGVFLVYSGVSGLVFGVA